MLTLGVALVGALLGVASGHRASLAAAAHAARQAAGSKSDQDAGGLAVQLPGWAWMLIGAIVPGVVGARFAHQSTLSAYLILALGAVYVSAVDLAALRIPDRTLAVLAFAVAACLTLQGLLGARVSSIGHAVFAAVVVGVFFLVIAVLAGGKFGLGDVKLLSLLAFVLAYQSWTSLEGGIMLGLALNAAAGLSLKATRDIRSLPLAPCLLAGALVALVV